MAHEVVAYVDVLGALVPYVVLGEVNAPAVVDLDVDRRARDRCLQPLRCQALQELVQPNIILAGLTQSNIIGLHRRQRHRLLQLRTPADGCSAKDEGEARRRTSPLVVTRPVGIT